jgi:dGTPase
LAKHRTPGKTPPVPGLRRCSSLEAQVADVADEIAYYSHDLDDGLEAGLLDGAALSREVEVWRQAETQVTAAHGQLADERRRYYTIRCIIDDQVRDVVETTARRLERARLTSADAVRARARYLVGYSAERRRLNLQLRRYLYAQLYLNPEVKHPNRRAAKMLEGLFRCYLERPGEMADPSVRRRARRDLHRAVCDYISGMTDRFAALEYERLIGAAPAIRHRGRSL